MITWDRMGRMHIGKYAGQTFTIDERPTGSFSLHKTRPHHRYCDAYHSLDMAKKWAEFYAEADPR